MNTSKKEIANYNLAPTNYHHTNSRDIADFTASRVDENIDLEVVKSFGEEWNKFHHFSKNPIENICAEYFDIIDETIINKDTYMIDIGCGRWSEYFTDKVNFIEALDPSDAVFATDKLLEESSNVRITKEQFKLPCTIFYEIITQHLCIMLIVKCIAVFIH